MSIYALNLFNVADEAEYLAYAAEAERGIARHGGRVRLLGRLNRAPVGDMSPRQVLMIVEWESMSGIAAYVNDPDLTRAHAHRDQGVSDFVWHLFDRVEDIGQALASVGTD